MKRLLLVTAIMVAASTVSAVEFTQGNLKLELFENSARFMLSYRDGDQWVPLLFPQDPRSTALEVLENNRVHRMGDSGAFSQDVEMTQFGPQFVWESPTLLVTQRFEFIRGVTASAFDALQIVVSVTNKGEEARELGTRFLFDTYLGEESGSHFYVSGTQEVTGERVISPSAANAYVTSQAEDDSVVGFQVVVDDEDVTTPEEIYLANWKRLSDSSWDFDANESRNFNRLPYSINDSAILITYEPAVVEPTGTYRTVVRLGNLAPSGYVGPETAAATSGETDVDTALLRRLSELINDIAALSLQDEITLEEVRALQEELNTLSNLVYGR